MINAVLFDLDETLLDRSGAIHNFVADQYGRFASALDRIGPKVFAERFLALEDYGRVPKDQFYPALVEKLGIKDISAAEMLEDYRQHYPSCAVLQPGAHATIAAIRADGLLTGVITNGNDRVQQAKLTATGLRDLLDIVVVSEAVGLRKPDPAICALATNDLGVASDRSIYVGDNPAVDIVGAAGAGLETAWFRNPPVWPEGIGPRATVEIDHLHEMLGYLER